jgi:hypothetical protein
MGWILFKQTHTNFEVSLTRPKSCVYQKANVTNLFGNWLNGIDEPKKNLEFECGFVL